MLQDQDAPAPGQSAVEQKLVQPASPLLGQVLCDAHGLDFSTVFAQQFHLHRDPRAALPGFARIKLGDWALQHGPDLPVAHLSFAEGTGHLAVMGIAVDPDGDVITTETLGRKCARWHMAENLIAWLNSCAGRYAFAVAQGPIQRLYLDPIGSLGAVYDPETARVASTLNLVLDRAVEPNHIYPLTDLANSEIGRFAFGHTPDHLVKRVIPNHFLDLHSFTLGRYWPLPGDIAEPGEDQQAALIQSIIVRLEQVIASLASHGPRAYLPLSGGLDSRLLLACAKPALDRITLFSHAENQMSRKDTRIAMRMARRVRSELTVIDPIRDPRYQITDPTGLQQLSLAQRIATGLGKIGTPVAQVRHEVLLAHPPGGLILRGNGVDFLKAVLWRRGVNEYRSGQGHDIKTGLRMMMLGDKSAPENPYLQDTYADWYADFGGAAAARAFDLMFAEQFLSHGLGNLFYGMANNFYICPFNDRALLGAATCLPPDKRAQFDYNQQILNWRAPELLSLPYTRKSVNQYLQAQRASKPAEAQTRAA